MPLNYDDWRDTVADAVMVQIRKVVDDAKEKDLESRNFVTRQVAKVIWKQADETVTTAVRPAVDEFLDQLAKLSLNDLSKLLATHSYKRKFDSN